MHCPQPPSPLETLHQLWTKEEMANLKMIPQYVSNLHERLQTVGDLAHVNLQCMLAKQAQNYFFLKTTHHILEVSNLVPLLLPTHTNTLHVAWQRLFPVALCSKLCCGKRES